MRMSRSRARARLGATQKPRVAPSVSPKANLRTRFHRTGTVTKGWRAKAAESTGAAQKSGRGGGGAAGLTLTLKISNEKVVRNVGPSFAKDKPDRWAAIEAGELPEEEYDDDLKKVPTDAEIEQAEADALDEIVEWGRSREAKIKAEAEAEAEALQDDADTLSPRAQRATASIQRDIARIWQKAEADMDDVGDQVREEREKARKQIMQDAEDKQEAVDKRIEELKKGLDDEVEKFAIDDYLEGTEATLVKYELK